MLRALNKKEGFTLIELLIVVAIIGILAAIAIPQFASYREKAYCSASKSDLANAAIAEEAYFVDNTAYTATLSDLVAQGFKNSANVTMAFTPVAGSPVYFTATAKHSRCTVGGVNGVYNWNSANGGLNGGV